MLRGYFLLLILLVTVLSGCKTEFERVRTSGDAAKIYEKANDYYENEEYGRAIILYELVTTAYRGRREAQDLAYKYAMSHFRDGNFVLSSHYFKNFADTYTGSQRREEALYLYAYSEYMQSARYKLEQSSTDKAIDAFQQFVNTYPDSERVERSNAYMDELREKLERKSYETGRLYYQMGSYNSAIQNLDNMMRDFPGSSLSEEALYLSIKASYDWAANSIYTRQQERYLETLDRCKLFGRKYPESKLDKKIENIINDCQKAIKSIANG